MFSLLILLSSVFCLTHSDTSSCSTFSCEYNVLLKLIQLEQKSSEQDIKIADLTKKLEEAKNTISELNDKIESSDGSTYIRWGRTTCPRKAVLVYDGYVAGSHYTFTGSAVNPLCLPKDPIYSNYTDGYQNAARVYGAEYETNTYPNWKYLHNHEIPCAVCRIPRSNIMMVPGKNSCHKNYKLEYRGFLMAEYYQHRSASEFVCVDENPETIGSHLDQNGKLFYFVEGHCGSLKCDPYKDGRELTCAVCSFSKRGNA